MMIEGRKRYRGNNYQSIGSNYEKEGRDQLKREKD